MVVNHSRGSARRSPFSPPPKRTARASGAPRWFGGHSYEVYLFHIILLGLMRNVTDKQHLTYAARPPWLPLFLALTALAAWLVAQYVSEPANGALCAYYLRRIAARAARP